MYIGQISNGYYLPLVLPWACSKPGSCLSRIESWGGNILESEQMGMKISTFELLDDNDSGDDFGNSPGE